MTLMSVIVAFLFVISLWYLSSNHKVTFVTLKATDLKFLPDRSWHRLIPAGGTFVSAKGGTFQSDTPGTFVSAMRGTIDSAVPGTFESDTGGTFNPLLSYLKDLESRGMSFRRLHEYAWMQLAIIDRLRLDGQDRIYDSDIEKVIKNKVTEDCSRGCIPSQKWIKTFRVVAYGWLSYAGILHKKQESESAEHTVVYQYLNWARDSKGLAFATLDGRKREPSASCHLFKARMICHPYLWTR